MIAPVTDRKCPCGADYEWQGDHFTCSNGMLDPDSNFAIRPDGPGYEDYVLMGRCADIRWAPMMDSA